MSMLEMTEGYTEKILRNNCNKVGFNDDDTRLYAAYYRTVEIASLIRPHPIIIPHIQHVRVQYCPGLEFHLS